MTVITLLAAILVACAASRPYEPDPPAPEARALSRSDGPVTVRAAALGADEGRDMLGAALHDVGIQPIWVEVENRDTVRYWLFPIAVDRDYFIPSEVLRRVGGRHPDPSIVHHIESTAMPVFIPPGSTRRGMLYVRADEGLKAVTVQLMTPHHRRDFPFVLRVPGLHRAPIPTAEHIYPSREIKDVDDAGLVSFVRNLPCCTTGAENRPGDPINFAIVASLDRVRQALASRGWTLAEVVSGSSSMKMAWAYLTNNPLRYAAVSDLQFFGRAQDLAFQKARNFVSERNHLRLWLAPVTWKGESVWVGQISRDVGVKLSGRLWPPTTHEIDAAVDEARFYLLQDLMASGLAARLSYTTGVGVAPRDAPRTNAEDDPYHTDGRRWIVMLRDARPDTSTIELFGDAYPDPSD